jgi:hypothetical protein
MSSEEKCPINNYPKKYDIYQFADHLFRKYGKKNAYIKFKQVVFFNDYQSLIQNIIKNITKRLDDRTRLLKYTYRKRSINYHIRQEDM